MVNLDEVRRWILLHISWSSYLTFGKTSVCQGFSVSVLFSDRISEWLGTRDIWPGCIAVPVQMLGESLSWTRCHLFPLSPLGAQKGLWCVASLSKSLIWDTCWTGPEPAVCLAPLGGEAITSAAGAEQRMALCLSAESCWVCAGLGVSQGRFKLFFPIFFWGCLTSLFGFESWPFLTLAQKDSMSVPLGSVTWGLTARCCSLFCGHFWDTVSSAGRRRNSPELRTRALQGFRAFFAELLFLWMTLNKPFWIDSLPWGEKIALHFSGLMHLHQPRDPPKARLGLSPWCLGKLWLCVGG